MNKTNQHSKNKTFKDVTEVYTNTKIAWSKSKEDIWANTFEQLEDAPEAKIIAIKPKPVALYIAASFALLLGLSGFIRFYTKSISCPAGQHQTALLPDGSTAEINANSVLKYKPYWWMIAREVQLEGEAFFKVKEGKAFVVSSFYGNTTVLGTSFNIYSRKETYEVTCLTGKVKVESIKQNQEVVLTPNYQATIQSGGQIFVNKEVNTNHSVAWINQDFVFTGESIHQVFEELSRQYDIEIVLPKGINRNYTGNFPKPANVEEALELICQPLGISYIRKSDKLIQITIN